MNFSRTYVCIYLYVSVGILLHFFRISEILHAHPLFTVHVDDLSVPIKLKFGEQQMSPQRPRTPATGHRSTHDHSNSANTNNKHYNNNKISAEMRKMEVPVNERKWKRKPWISKKKKPHNYANACKFLIAAPHSYAVSHRSRAVVKIFLRHKMYVCVWQLVRLSKLEIHIFLNCHSTRCY